MAPAYDAVLAAVAACGLEPTVALASADSSYLHDVGRRLRMEPIERLRRLGSERHVDMIRRLATRKADVIVIGDGAAALQGWPLRLNPDGDVEVCSTAAAACAVESLDRVRVLERPPGTRGYGDLHRHCELVDVPGGRVRVASPLDLLRIERARNHVVQAGAIEAVLEHRRRWPDGPPPQRQYTEQEADAAIEAWLSAT